MGKKLTKLTWRFNKLQKNQFQAIHSLATLVGTPAYLCSYHINQSDDSIVQTHSNSKSVYIEPNHIKPELG